MHTKWFFLLFSEIFFSFFFSVFLRHKKFRCFFWTQSRKNISSFFSFSNFFWCCLLLGFFYYYFSSFKNSRNILQITHETVKKTFFFVSRKTAGEFIERITNISWLFVTLFSFFCFMLIATRVLLINLKTPFVNFFFLRLQNSVQSTPRHKKYWLRLSAEYHCCPEPTESEWTAKKYFLTFFPPRSQIFLHGILACVCVDFCLQHMERSFLSLSERSVTRKFLLFTLLLTQIFWVSWDKDKVYHCEIISFCYFIILLLNLPSLFLNLPQRFQSLKNSLII